MLQGRDGADGHGGVDCPARLTGLQRRRLRPLGL